MYNGIPCKRCYWCKCGWPERCTDRVKPSTLCRCDSCKYRDGLPNRYQYTRMHYYSMEPDRGWRKYHDGATDTDTVYMGVELETDASTYTVHDTYGYPLDDVVCDMAQPRYVWPVHASDGSVSGPEFKSHVLTIARWKRHERSIRSMMKRLVHAGYRSHNGGHAGLHINIDKASFNDAQHVWRMYTLGMRSQDEFTTLSGRGGHSHYAEFTDYSESTIVDAYNGYHRWSDGVDKYTWLNVHVHEDHVEFRLPRGTLRWDRFIARIEWTHSMVEFTRVMNSPRLCTWRMYRRWLDVYATEYPALIMMCKEFNI